MDTSPEYINMCRKATELQEKWEPSLGDWYYSDFSKLICVMSEHMQFNRDKRKEYSDAIWLPRIDQHIQMACAEDTDFFIACIKIEDKLEPDASAERKGLAVVMGDIYNKSWNGEDWICTLNTTA